MQLKSFYELEKFEIRFSFSKVKRGREREGFKKSLEESHWVSREEK